MKIIAFWKDNPGSSFYEDSAKALAASAKRFGYETIIEHRADAGEGYTSITRFKPLFILEKLEEAKEAVMYVDVDSTLRFKEPFTSEKIIFNARRDGAPEGHALYFPYAKESINFLNLWADELVDWKGGDHSKLLELWHAGRFPARPFSKPFVGLVFSKSPSKREEVAALEAEGWREEVLTLRAEAIKKASDANTAPVSVTEADGDTLPADGGQEAPEALKIAPKAKPAKKPAAKKAKKAPAKKKAAPKKKDEK